MKHFEQLSDLREQVSQWRKQGLTVGFVPTMGNLHEGHLQLIDTAQKHAEKVIVSIFVNPMQFGENEDLDAYPRTLEADKTALTMRGADAVFTPSVKDVYPRGLTAQTFVEVPEISNILCGASRPGHFRGVATVVCKLLNMVQPDVAVFGKKDYQQLMVIRLMAQDLSMPVSIIGMETSREESGLARSSRNGFLSAEQKQLASEIYKSMQSAASAIQEQSNNLKSIEADCTEQLRRAGFKPDYFSIRRQSDLLEPTTRDTDLVILVAAYIESATGTTRLIDNLEVVR